MIDRIRSWFSETRAIGEGYTVQRLAGELLAARGLGGIKSTAAFQGCLNEIEKAMAVAEPSGEFSESLRPLLGGIGRALTDTGNAVFQIAVSGAGGLQLWPCSIVSVSGGANPGSWTYSLLRRGPSETTSIVLPGASVLAFRAHSDHNHPWRGRGALEASATGQLLAELEKQLAAESRFTPARLVSGSMVKDQRKEVKDTIAEGGIVTISGGKAGGTDSTKALEVGSLKGEFTQAGVDLHLGLSRLIAGAVGVPSEILLGGSESGAREAFRRFSASTISSLIEIVQTEWALKIGALSISQEALRAGDISARARAIGSRSAAFKNLTAGGVEVDRALQLVGLVDG